MRKAAFFVLALLVAAGRVSFAGPTSIGDPTPNTTPRNQVNDQCPAGSVVSGVEVRTNSTSGPPLKAHCRPIPTGSTDWCNTTPPASVPCNCDAQREKLQWVKEGSCWVCKGTKDRC